MKDSYVNLTVNPCKMCMPMGVVNAVYGIKGAMTILHGSQGCSTYIRRHMATHYNEPVDIASSSLTEEGTVYGGEKNLLKGLENLIKLYNPEVIAIATTCLAETIGEDIKAISKIFYESHPDSKVKLIPISSPGYGGTQYDGYFSALKAVVENVEMYKENNDRVNVITSLISPADTRELKEILNDFGIEYTMLPDISENLDGGHRKNYSRLSESGTTIEDVKYMAGAKATIELTTFISDECSVGKYLEDNYDVKNYRLNIPRGLRDTDALMKLLSKLSGKEIPKKYMKQRERYLDGMIDSHKYNAAGRLAIFGEPDFVYSTARLALENGALPVVLSTGEVCDTLEDKLKDEMDNVSSLLFAGDYKILNDADFKEIEKWILELKANVMIGSSDGRRIEEKHKIPLIRASFPIHDRIGGQRLMTVGYEGSLMLLDNITNTVLQKKEGNFREEIYEEFYTKKKVGGDKMEKVNVISNEEKTKTHPCFSCDSAHKYARMHLPIAPKCNISCNYCLRKYDCPNESRPGVTTEVLSPEKAFEKYKLVKEKMPNLKVVGIAGPGDALANFDEVKKSLELIKEYDEEVTFCLSTNGLMLPFYAKDLVELGVSHVTITINAVDPKITAKVYKYVDYLGVKYVGEEGARILLNNQLSGLKYLTNHGVVCKVNIVMLKGINDDHIEEVVKKVKDLGATITNIMQMIPVKGSAFENMPLVSNKEVMDLRKKCGEHLKQMYHCKQCRADAIGLLGDDKSLLFSEKEKEKNKVKSEDELKVAVVSKSGMIVDQHFGHATELYIYKYNNGDVSFVEKRNIKKYCDGVDSCDGATDKIRSILKSVEDCQGVLALRIGDSPANKLKAKGIEVFMTYERVEEAVKAAAEEILSKKKSKYVLKV